MHFGFSSRRVGLGLLAAAVTACGSGSDSDKHDTSQGPANTNYELNMTDELAPPANMTNIEESAISGKINAVSDFYQHAPKKSDSGSRTTDLGNCEALKNVKLKSGMGYVEMQMDEDLVSCFQGNERKMIESFRLAMFMRMECPDDDLSALDGKTIYEASSITSTDGFCSRSNVRRQINWSRVNAEMNLFGKIKTISVSGMASANGKPCEMSLHDGAVTYGDCIRYQRQTDDLPADNGQSSGGLKMTADNKIIAVNLTGVTGDQKSRFYSAGAANFRVNNWSGQMVYSGPEKEPTWTAESDGRKKLGTYVGRALLSSGGTDGSSTPGSIAQLFGSLE